MKKSDVAKKMRGTGIKGLSTREAERNDAWFRKGKGYPPAKGMSQKGRASLNPAYSKTGKNEGNNLYEGPNEQQKP